jgi:hypothetical protein
MDKAGKWFLYHLGSALGARDSRNRVSWPSAHLLDFPTHEAYRKELSKRQEQLERRPLYDPSSTLALVRKWGPSTRNILGSMESAALGHVDGSDREAEAAAYRICKDPSAIFEGFGIRIPRNECSSVLFLRRTPNESVTSNKGKAFIPTPHLLALFEERRKRNSNKESLELFYVLSSHALTRTAAGWAHENSVHERLCMGGADLSIFRGPTEKHMRPSTRLLPGTLAGLEEAGTNDSFYWIPSVANLPGVDGVLGDTDGHVYAIQAAIGHDHKNPIDGITRVWQHFLPEVRAGRIWHYVVVTNTKQAADDYVDEFSKELRDFTLGDARARVQVWACVLSP